MDPVWKAQAMVREALDDLLAEVGVGHQRAIERVYHALLLQEATIQHELLRILRHFEPEN